MSMETRDEIKEDTGSGQVIRNLKKIGMLSSMLITSSQRTSLHCCRAIAAEQAHRRGETVRAVNKRRKRCLAGGYGAYVVFVGATPGVYLEW